MITNEYIEIDDCPNCGHDEYIMPKADMAVCANCNKLFKIMLHVPGASYNARANWDDYVFARTITVPKSLVINRVDYRIGEEE